MMRELLLGVALVLGGLSALADNRTNSFNVRDFGATGDGKAKDTGALQKALDACAKAGGGTVQIPAGVYLTGSIVIGANTIVQLNRGANLTGSPDAEDYPITRVRWEGEFTSGHRSLICAENATNISIIGSGSIFGPPIGVSRLRNPRGPSLMEFMSCTNVVLDGFSTQYQQLWSIHPALCENFTARNLTIRSINFNADGIDVDSCREVLIEDCDIDTGDDAISLKSGRGLEAVRLARPTEKVLIRNCTLSSSIFGGIGIGSEMSGGIRNVRVENCIISGRKNAVLIKSREGRGGFIENLTFENLIVQNSPNFLSIDLLKRGIQASEPVTESSKKWPRVRDLTFRNVRLKNVGELVSAKNISPEQPVEGLTLANFSGDCRTGITLANVNDARLSDINVTGFTGELVTTNAINIQTTSEK